MATPALNQHVLWCNCGNEIVNAAGRCATCDRRRRLSLEDFGGLREKALERDGYRCRSCGELDDLLVHHRKPEVNELRWLITLCRGCHSRVHATWRPWYGFPELLLQLWRAAHPEIAEQSVLPFIQDPQNGGEQLVLM